MEQLEELEDVEDDRKDEVEHEWKEDRGEGHGAERLVGVQLDHEEAQGAENGLADPARGLFDLKRSGYFRVVH